jgi:catechol 2,3-dioxygenase-like lactoylglutathione lyase family enzyme
VITEIAFFCYPVSSIPAARRFYEEVLGLQLAHNFADEWLEYDLQGVTLAITTLDKEHAPGRSGGVIAFEVDDLDAFVAGLRSKQVKFKREPMSTPVCRAAVINDPDGNEIILHKRNG